ncbi:DUF4166 domain-containing protein [Bacillus alkalicellulosilyticus]|uniref:DUF4166 domain-containing protein n=1 Tax=Alkalihalobacterium alkalicellulosilyticum TaxID=1912214 RepID=UPI000996ECD2|nr:DUF4166 domain-containing protein [Bacillus alkalicellulosilyticus]
MSIYEKALGKEYKKMHPKLQEKFGLTSQANIASISRGVMDEIWGGRIFMYPFLQLGTLKHISFRERGSQIPFTLENYAYKNSIGQECMAWNRSFNFSKTRHFDATMVYSSKTKGIVDYLGIDQDFVTKIDLSVLENGGIRLLSGPLVFNNMGIKFNIPSFISGVAEAVEWYDEINEKFHIKVEVKNKMFGTIFGYKGTFKTEYYSCTGGIPKNKKPRKEGTMNVL